MQQWMREVMNRELDSLFRALPPQEHDAVEVSGDIRGDYAWRSYVSTGYPGLDLCDRGLEPAATFSIVICEQVLEHVADPDTAVLNLKKMCRPGGRIVVSTPFLVKIHGHPGDYWRFTPQGLRGLLEKAGLRVEWVHTWGNRACVRQNLGRWLPYRRGRSLRNDPECPVMVWALATPP